MMNFKELTQMAIGLLFLLTPIATMAQTNGTQGPTASNIPVFASGVMLPTVPGAEEVPTNVFEGSVNVNTFYDDNVFPNVTPREWDISYAILPEISFTETHPRLEWKLDYSPGVEISQRYFYRDIFSQKLGANFVGLVSPHGTLSGEQYYVVTTNPFAGTSATSPGPIIGPNETIYIPNVRQTWLLSHLMYSYQSSAQTTMGLGATYALQQFDSIPQSGPTTPLIHAQVASGEAFIARQLTPRNQLGFQYGLQVLKFQQTDASTTTHSFLVFDQMNLSSTNSLTIYGGPEYSLTFNQVALSLGFVVISIPVRANEWTGSGGVMYNWTGNHLAASIDFSRRVSDGGALIGAVELTSGKADLVWQLTRNWSLTSTIAGADETLLAVNNTAGNELRSYSGQIGVRRQFLRDLGIRCFYERLNQTGSIDGLAVGNRDIVGASLQYSFLRPVGR
jgi:hypothetical protein